MESRTQVPSLEKHIYLASRSARRRDLLKQMGVNFEMLLLREGSGRDADFDESVRTNEMPHEYVVRVARLKVEAGWLRLEQRRLMRHPVLAGDTTVAFNNAILAKPKDREEAVAMLKRLHTAVAVRFHDTLVEALSTTEVRLRSLSDDEIRRYVASGDPMDKAGAYGIQGKASMFIESINGSYSGVVGLPMFETSQLLTQFGFQLL
jgi:septum formation protein